jgi:DNA-binding CsgD family transcriptional regulator
MDDDPCRRFFLVPHQLLQRRYEVLRAFFVEQRPQAEIAAQFGLSPATVQSLIRDFRAQLRNGQASPFFSSLDSAGPSATRRWLRPCSRRCRLSATAVK